MMPLQDWTGDRFSDFYYALYHHFSLRYPLCVLLKGADECKLGRYNPVMDLSPEFLNSPLNIVEEETFQPTAIPKKGGLIAWAAAFLIGIAAMITIFKSGQIPCLTMAIFLFFLFAAILITFSHWVDSQTSILVTPSQISYQSPFRRFLQNWDQISELTLIKAGHFWRVTIRSEHSFFMIRVDAGLASKPSPERILALPNGDRLVRIICGMANLSQVDEVGDSWVCRRTSGTLDG